MDSDIITFGKYKDKDFKYVLDNDNGYCKFVLKQTDTTCKNMILLQSYLKENLKEEEKEEEFIEYTITEILTKDEMHNLPDNIKDKGLMWRELENNLFEVTYDNPDYKEEAIINSSNNPSLNNETIWLYHNIPNDTSNLVGKWLLFCDKKNIIKNTKNTTEIDQYWRKIKKSNLIVKVRTIKRPKKEYINDNNLPIVIYTKDGEDINIVRDELKKIFNGCKKIIKYKYDIQTYNDEYSHNSTNNISRFEYEL